MTQLESTQTLHPFRGKGLRLLLAILIVALNLRGAITCIGPLLETIQFQYKLSGLAAGLLTSLPLFAFGFLSPYAAILARRIGIERAIFLSLLLLLGGLSLRYIQSVFFLYLGTAFIGSGIAFSNVLLPGLLRRDFPAQLTTVTALFTMILVTFGGLGSGMAIGLANWGGWRFSLFAWLIPAVIALIFWIPQLRNQQVSTIQARNKGSLWKSPLAWQVSLFMGLQSSGFYVMIAWFPSMMNDIAGISASRSGWILFIYQIAILFSVMLTPIFIKRMDDQRLIGVALSLFMLLGYCGLLFDSQHAVFWMIVMGLGSGGALVLSLTFFGLRVRTAEQSVSMSAMAQSIAYTMAALTPIIIGFVNDLTSQWTLPLLIVVLMMVVQVYMGYMAGRPLTIEEATEAKI